ncbi:rRNA cytosine-C5-methylase [Ferrovibrio sp.]|uniref:rRNA cytosine-C5-methylase n=1 Tax=Ferrovibrio sp. TaxID=1917215 RepID=UPI0035B0C84F
MLVASAHAAYEWANSATPQIGFPVPKPPSGRRPPSGRPSSGRPSSDRPRTDRSKADRPRTDRPKADWSRQERPGSGASAPRHPGKAAGGKGAGGKVAGGKPGTKSSAGRSRRDEQSPDWKQTRRPRPEQRARHARQDRDQQSGREQTERRPEHRPGQKQGQKQGGLRPAGSRKVAEAAVALLDAMFPSRDTADRVRHAWMKQHHRQFDAAEREAIIQISDDVMRLRGRLDWWISEGQAGLPPDNRLRVAAYRILNGGAKASGLLPLFGGDKAVEVLLRRLEGHTLDHPDMPAAARHSVPEWLLPALKKRFGGDFDMELAAMLRPAPLDVRVNTLKTTRDAAMAALAAEDLRCQFTPLSPIGLRLSPSAYVNNTQAFADGLLEPQDEGSQIAALLVDAAGCKFVADFCAGAGGKTLVLGTAMRNAGRLVAMDVSEGRLTQAKLRLRRAGVHNAECRPLEAKWLKRHGEKADRVLVDAPCSGSGTWRRKPDAKWRLTPQDVAELTERQAEILDRAAKLLRKGGRLVYVTCSVLKEENEDQVAAFLKRHPDFRVLPVTDVWEKTVGGACPVPGPYLNLTPARHGTDGFFAAILVRNA